MLNAQQVHGQWNSLRGKIKEKWGQLTDDDLRVVSGNVDQLVGTIQQKTGEAKEEIEQFINGLMSNPSLKRAAEVATDYAQQAAASVRDSYDEVSEQVRQGAEVVQKQVKEHPTQSMLACFGLGIITGIVVGTVLRHE
jgi:uncharacterized protein YjbJ (UPF0337 family)